jgi:hypothetical protein
MSSPEIVGDAFDADVIAPRLATVPPGNEAI